MPAVAEGEQAEQSWAFSKSTIEQFPADGLFYAVKPMFIEGTATVTLNGHTKAKNGESADRGSVLFYANR